MEIRDHVIVGKIYDVLIEEQGRQGEGLTLIEGLVVFVPHTRIGDHVKMRVKSINQPYGFGEVVAQ